MGNACAKGGDRGHADSMASGANIQTRNGTLSDSSY